ncbi:hypothetical protein [Alicyclobacillus fastidiosus]|uniref:Uncharacterized protein n=1 Tax=Alicyclobacillus fastidiosus TaxID=392011 RepID=A0ABV5ALJ5_9BACL
MVELDNTAIIDVDQALYILRTAGSEALAVYLVYEAANLKDGLSVGDIAELTNLSVVQVEKACYQFGMAFLGINSDFKG